MLSIYRPAAEIHYEVAEEETETEAVKDEDIADYSIPEDTSSTIMTYALIGIIVAVIAYILKGKVFDFIKKKASKQDTPIPTEDEASHSNDTDHIDDDNDD